MTQAPDNPFLEATAAHTRAFEDRLIALELLLEKRDNDQDDEHRKLLIAEIRQRMHFRFATMCVAAFVLVCMLVYAYCAYSKIASWWHVSLPSPVAVALIAVPIFSATTITALMLFGAFRRFKEDDPEKVSQNSLAAMAAEKASGL